MPDNLTAKWMAEPLKDADLIPMRSKWSQRSGKSVILSFPEREPMPVFVSFMIFRRKANSIREKHETGAMR